MLTSVGKDPTTHIVTTQAEVQGINDENMDVVNHTEEAIEEEEDIFDDKRGERNVGT